ncbi:hypothetical protein [Metabacillus endolithicus]|uniref:HPr kinase/phosphorylase C-terminal domain-containing protein n=1 Tax=Metabacillus endolithicus TaxID=1535204 RepID=A0ABW5BVT6_9BACI|nr:hypothetical protein [Metabacillus endolithicus]UPG64484.1 hypothetical protein MVE64_05175 [Metabacillus endolithicus]
MYKVMVKIAEHNVLLTSYSIDFFTTLNNSYLILNNENSNPDLSIHLEDGYGVPFESYEVSISKNQQYVSYKRADYLIRVDHLYKNAMIWVHNDLALKHALMNLYSSFIVYHNWGILLHSSCVIDNGNAHIFSGHSGAGKSTAAKLSTPRDLLADEASIIQITSNKVIVFDSPFRSELHSKCMNTSFKLESIQLLHQSQLNKREQLSKSSSMLHLLDKVFYWTESSGEMTKIFHLICNLVKQVPIYDLHFQKNNTFWEMIS